MEKTKVDYDEEFDDLFVYKEGNAEYTVNIGDFVIDISKTGKIVGIEIMNATETIKELSQLKLPKNILKNLKGAEIFMRKKQNALFIGLLLYFSIKKFEKVPIHIVTPEIKAA